MATTTRQEQGPTTTLEVRRTFAAPRERVFHAWTSAEELGKWSAPGPMTPAATVDLRVGGRYRIVMRGPDGDEKCAAGVYRVVQPPSMLVYTWRWEGQGIPDQGDSVVTVEFREQGRGTEVVLRHEGLPSAESRDRHDAGWNGCLDKLGSLLNR